MWDLIQCPAGLLWSCVLRQGPPRRCLQPKISTHSLHLARMAVGKMEKSWRDLGGQMDCNGFEQRRAFCMWSFFPSITFPQNQLTIDQLHMAWNPCLAWPWMDQTQNDLYRRKEHHGMRSSEIYIHSLYRGIYVQLYQLCKPGPTRKDT